MDTAEKLSRKEQLEMSRAEARASKPQATSPNEFRFSASALKWGISAGLVMVAYLVLLHQSSAADSVAMKFGKYLFLFGFVGWGLWKYRFVDRTRRFFRRAILLTAMVSFYAALTLAIISFVLGLAVPEISFDKFGMTVDSVFDQFILSGTMLFEAFAFGMISGLVWLQYLKQSVPGEDAA
jgi:nitrate reductase gamma subunit